MKLIFMLSLLVSYAFAKDCKYNIVANNFLGTLQNTTQAVSYQFTVSRARNGKECKSFRAYNSKGSSPTYNRSASSGSHTIPYNLYSDSSLVTVLKDYPDAVTAGEYIAGNLP